MKAKLTKRVVDSTETGSSNVFVWDTEVKGFGLKITPAGRRVYVLQYRMDGQGRTTSPTRYTIGTHGSPWTPDQARDEAKRLLGQVKAGSSPQEAKRRARDAYSNAEITFEAAADMFIERYAKPKNRSWPASKRTLEHDVLPHWRKRPLSSISRGDVIKLLDGIVDRGAPIQANRTLSVIRRMFNWSVERDMIEKSPCAGVRPPSKENSRDRVLSNSEIVEIWYATDVMGYPFGPIFQLLLLTGQREDEMAGMCWREIDFRSQLWTIPKERTNNKREHDVFLCDEALLILEHISRQETKDGEPIDFVFTTTGRTPVSGFSKAKRRIDAYVLAERKSAAESLGHDPELATPLPSWVIHDYRRSAATGMADMDVPLHVVERLLNHISGTISGVAAIYNRHTYWRERCLAHRAWGRRVRKIITGVPFDDEKWERLLVNA